MMLFGEQKVQENEIEKEIVQIQESQISEKVQEKSAEKINVCSQPEINDENMLFGS
jgi:hypothetical protein